MGQIQFEIGSTTLPGSRIQGGSRGRGKQADAVPIAYPDKSNLKRTDIINFKKLENLSKEEAQPYLMAKILELILDISSEEETFDSSKPAIDAKKAELLEISPEYRELVALEEVKKKSSANKKNLRELKNALLLDAERKGIDISADAIKTEIQHSGKKKLNYKSR